VSGPTTGSYFGCRDSINTIPVEAVHRYQHKQGYADAQNSLGPCFETALAVPKRPKKLFIGFVAFEQACPQVQGPPLGLCLPKVRVLLRVCRSCSLLLTGVEQAYPQTPCALTSCLQKGGATRKAEEAMHWFG
jgi:TPR repeat protein